MLNPDLPTRAWLSLVTAITCWTLSPFLISKTSGLAPSPIVALFAVAIGATFGLLLLAQSAALNVRALIRANRRQGTVGKAVAIGAGTFLAYPLLYFSALQGADSLALVNLVNYLWPVVGVALVATRHHEDLSLETMLAIAFGLAGAAIAISTVHAYTTEGTDEIMPFVLAGLGAIVYGGVSAFMRLYPDEPGAYHTQMLVLALLVAGLVAYLTLGVMFLAHRAWVRPHWSSGSVPALVLYSLLLPVAHLSWLTAVQDRRVPTFPAAFVIPVTGTGLLTLAISGLASPAVLSALVLVLCGIAFSTMSQQTVPLRFAVTLGFLASIQVSQGLRGTIQGSVDSETGLLAQVLVALLAIFAGFVLTNAIRRHNTLQLCCAAFYGKVIASRSTLSSEERLKALNCLDRLVLTTGDTPTDTIQDGAERPAQTTRRAASPHLGGLREALTIGDEDLALPAPRPASQEAIAARGLFPEEWARVDVALSNKVSLYEWLVLLLGSSGLIIAVQLYGVNSHSAATVIVRAFTIAVTAGVVFAIRDYDRNRPIRIMKTLVALRNGFGLALAEDSPLVEAQRLGGKRRIGPWEVVGLSVLVISALVAVTLNLGW